MIDFTSPTFIGSESDEVVSVQVMILEGIISSKIIYVVITLIKTHSSESRGQEEAACTRVFWPTRPLQ